MLSGYAKNERFCDVVDVFEATSEKNVMYYNVMFTLYLVIGDFMSARKVFDKMTERNIASWNVLVNGYAKMGRMRKACELFDEMLLMISSLLPPNLDASISSNFSILSGSSHSIRRHGQPALYKQHGTDTVCIDGETILIFKSPEQVNSVLKNFERLHKHLKDIPNYTLHLPPKMIFSSRKDKSVVLWSIHDQVSTLVADQGDAKCLGSRASNPKPSIEGPIVQARGFFQGQDDTVEDAQFLQIHPIGMESLVAPRMPMYPPGGPGVGQQIFYGQPQPALLPPQTDSETETESETETVGSSHLTDMPRSNIYGVQPVPRLEGCHYRATGKDNSM
ncbi:hypothetical protein FXO37_22264 [Capsicum annuum]|nr:hypothetical protein FXO37_22264 [Capsicum annuum]